MSQLIDQPEQPILATATQRPANLHFDRIGGKDAIRRLVDLFYHYMDTLPEAQTIRAMHPPELAPVKEVLFKYLVGWLGGPPLYVAERGHPRLRKRHLAFPIGEAERDAWMACMTRAIDDVVTDPALKTELTQAFSKTATFLRNQ
ncbi:MAG: group II truncated hemoglobin [Rugosibacter sp.]|jgi:hemoglobin|nr:hemoglobin [Rugosibacter sp.]